MCWESTLSRSSGEISRIDMAIGRSVKSLMVSSNSEYASGISRSSRLADQSIIVGVAADPEPDKAVRRFDSEGAIVLSNPD